MESIETILKKTGAIKEGHFLLTSGLHSGVYFEKFRLLQHPEYTEKLCEPIANFYKNEDIDLVVGPTLGGVIIAYEVARLLGKPCAFAEKTQNGRNFLRDFDLPKSGNVLVVDDVLTTGGSIKEVLELVKKCGLTPIGIGVLIERSEKTPDFGNIPLFSVYRVEVKNYTKEECPLCKKGIPLVKPGGKSYV